MKKLLLFTAVFIIGLQSYSQWEPQTVDTNIQLQTIFMLDENLGWISGFNYNTQTPYGLIYKTTNGGITWDSIASVPLGVMEIQFVDSLTGWGNLTWSFEDGIYKTEDGGITWNLIFPGENGISFINNSVGFLLENYNDTLLLPASLYKTIDGGETWQFIDSIGGYNPDSTFFSDPGCLEFITENVGYVSLFWQGGGGFSGQSVIKTHDGGLSWTGADLPNLGLQELYFITEDVGYATCGGYLVSGLYKTLDGAESWEKIYDEYVSTTFFITPENGWIGRPYGEESILYTGNSGSSWDTQYSGNSISDIFFTDSLNGWAVGSNGLILHTNNAGGTVTHINENKSNLESMTIYPNPVSETVTFVFVMEKQEAIIIDVYNALGVKVATPTCQTFSQGLHQLEWNASYLDDGIYFCNFNIGKFSTTKRFIKK